METETDTSQETQVDDVQSEQTEQKEVDAEEQQTEVKDEQQETAETKIGIIQRIKNIVKGTPESDGDTDADVEGDDIPEDFTKAALDAGWTETQIKEHSSDYSDDELRKQIPYLGTSSENSDESEQLSQKEGDIEKKDEQVKDDKKDEVIAKLTERLDKLEKGQEKNIKQDAQAKLESQASRATQVMDEQSKEFEVFGTFETLPRFPDGRIIPNSPQNIARNEVWGLALQMEKAGMDFEIALSTSLNAFKGKNLVNDVKRNLVKDLKKSEKKLSAKHSSHEQVKTNLTGLDVIREVKKKHGID